MLILFALTCTYITLVFVLEQGTNSKLDRTQCTLINANRQESNSRAPQHEADAHNLYRLTRALAHNRKLEADAFEQIGEAFHIPKEVDPLVHTLRRASQLDAQIEADQAKLHFNLLPLDSCDG